MATGAPLVLVAATPTLVSRNPQRDHTQQIVLVNSTAALLYVGGNAVSATNFGDSLAAGTKGNYQLAPQDSLFVFSTAGGTVNALTSP